MKEDHLYEQIAQYMNLKHPAIIYHFDLSGLWTPSHKARNLYGRLNRRAWPDLLMALPRRAPIEALDHGIIQSDTYSGLFLELKREGTRLKKRDGSWANDHVAEQAVVLEQLAEQGYIAQFAVGFEQAVDIIESYIGGAL